MSEQDIIVKIFEFFTRVNSHIERFSIWIFPYIKRVFLMIKANIWYIIWFGFYFNYSLSFLILVFKQHTLLIGILVYGVSLTVAHFFGDTIFKLIEGVRSLETKREKEYLTPIFEEVYQDIKEQHPELPRIQIHIVDTLTVNGFAIGNHTVAVTHGAVETFNVEELKGIIAHEISHIYYGDTKAAIINTIGNGIFTILTIVVKLFLKGLEFISNMFDESKAVTAAVSLIRFIFEILVFYFLWVGMFILSFNNRGNEYRSDKFAHETGYGEQLIEALYIIQKMSLGQKMKIVTRLQARHPRISKRIGRLEALADGEFEG